MKGKFEGAIETGNRISVFVCLMRLSEREKAKKDRQQDKWEEVYSCSESEKGHFKLLSK